jgi:hypothetical protein
MTEDDNARHTFDLPEGKLPSKTTLMVVRAVLLPVAGALALLVVPAALFVGASIIGGAISTVVGALIILVFAIVLPICMLSALAVFTSGAESFTLTRAGCILWGTAAFVLGILGTQLAARFDTYWGLTVLFAALLVVGPRTCWTAIACGIPLSAALAFL